METLTTSQARDHIEMVDQILSRSERSLRWAVVFLVWDLWAAAVTPAFQPARLVKSAPTGASFCPYCSRRTSLSASSAARPSSARRVVAPPASFSAAQAISLVVTLSRSCRLPALSGIRQFGAMECSSGHRARALLHALARQPRAPACGVITIGLTRRRQLSRPHYAGYALAAGMLFGYAGFGLISLIARD